MLWQLIVFPLIGAVVGLAAGYTYRKNIVEAKRAKTEESVAKMISDAQKKAEAIKKETVLEAKEEVLKMRNELELEIKERRNETQRTEKRIMQREEMLDKKLFSIEKKKRVLQ